MTPRYSLRLYFAALCVLTSAVFAVERDNPSQAEFRASDVLLMVPPAGPGVYEEQKSGASGYRLTVKGHNFTSRGEIERYLAYRAAELAKVQKAAWFTLKETRAKDDVVAVSKRDPTGKRYGFRMEFWRPVWRFKLAGDSTWKNWSPFSGAPFFAQGVDPKTITDFEVTADVTLHKGPMDDSDPLAFETWALSDFLVNQVSPPT